MKNIVFDLGNVLIDFSPKEYIEKNISKEYSESFYHTVFASKEWIGFDKGTVSYEEARIIFKNKLPQCNKEIDDFLDYKFFDMLVPIWQNVKIFEELVNTGKYKFYILSNFHKEAIEALKSRYKFFDKFDDEVISCYCHLLKPDDEIYEYLIDKFKLDPKETMFIDDTEINVKNAEKFGITGVHLPDYTKLREKLSFIL